MKRCEKGLHEYASNGRGCPQCRHEYHLQWVKNNRDKTNATRRRYFAKNVEKLRTENKRASLMWKFGITIEKYDEMFAAQLGRCAICNTHQSELPRAMAVDHCHKTNKIRSLLCGLCNMGLGKFHDNSSLLRAAAEYLDAKT